MVVLGTEPGDVHMLSKFCGIYLANFPCLFDTVSQLSGLGWS